MATGNMAALGEALVELGELMQDGSATIDQLVKAADKCGMRLGFGLVPGDHENTQQQEGEK